jgi:hypothetical protein
MSIFLVTDFSLRQKREAVERALNQTEELAETP